jgi:hypothetical protein
LGAGVAAMGAGGYFVYAAVRYKADVLDPSYQAYSDAPAGYSGTPPWSALGSAERQTYFDSLWSTYQGCLAQFRTRTILGFGLAGGGLAAGIGGVALLASLKASPGVAVVIEPTLRPVGVSLFVRY